MSATAGWDAISAHLAAAYPGQEPRHWGTIMRASAGGRNPLDGISAYRADGPPHWHWVGLGLSELGEKRSDDREVPEGAVPAPRPPARRGRRGLSRRARPP